MTAIPDAGGAAGVSSIPVNCGNRGCNRDDRVAGMAGTSEWVLLAYRLPREPSTPRITVWRKLRRLGVLQLVDGLVALPATPANREQFDWLADEIIEAEGEAWTWAAVPGTKAQQEALAARLSAAVADDYRALLDEVQAAADADGPVDGRPLARFRRELRRIEARDHFGSRDGEPVNRAIARLTAPVISEEVGR
jgi:hypothetical protein